MQGGVSIILETWDLKSETHWACGRPMAPYKGAYPQGFLKRLDKSIGLKDNKILTFFKITVKIYKKFIKTLQNFEGILTGLEKVLYPNLPQNFEVIQHE